MQFELKTGPQGHIYFPKLVRKAFGDKIVLLPIEVAGAIYPKGTNPEDVIASLETIIATLKIQQKMACQNVKKEMTKQDKTLSEETSSGQRVRVGL